MLRFLRRQSNAGGRPEWSHITRRNGHGVDQAGGQQFGHQDQAKGEKIGLFRSKELSSDSDQDEVPKRERVL